jgi:hypothetical protein
MGYDKLPNLTLRAREQAQTTGSGGAGDATEAVPVKGTSKQEG